MVLLQQCKGSMIVGVIILRQTIQLSKQCIFADAFVLQRTNVKTDDESILMIHNKKPFLDNRKAIQISQHTFNDRLISDLKKGKRIVYVSCSRSDLLELETRLIKECPDKKFKIYDRDTDKSDLSNVNEIWSQLDLVAYTPCIQTGVSYMDKPFDLCYANLKSSNLTRDAQQMLMRCRILNDNIVYFSLNKRQIYDTENIHMFENYTLFENDRKQKVNLMIKQLSTNKLQNNGLIDMLQASLHSSDPLLLRIMWYNLREYILSKCHYNMLCVKLLESQNYQVQLLSDNEENKDKTKDKSNLNRLYC